LNGASPDPHQEVKGAFDPRRKEIKACRKIANFIAASLFLTPIFVALIYRNLKNFLQDSLGLFLSL